MVILLIIIFVAVFILVHELGHFYMARRNKVGVDEFAIGFPPRLWSKKKNNTEYSINAIPLGGYVKLHGEEKASDDKSFLKKSVWQRFKIISAGVLMNLLLAYIILIVYFSLAGSPIAFDPSRFSSFIKSQSIEPLAVSILDNSAAQKMGFKIGDIIQKVNGQKITTADDFSNFTKTRAHEKITIQIERGAEQKTLTGVVGEEGGRGSLGVGVANYYPQIHFKWWAIPLAALIDLFSIIGVIFYFFWNLILVLFHKARPIGEVVGPVGVYYLAKEAAGLGFIYILRLMALLSINLAVVNFLPFPALDGGRALFLLIEKIRGKRANEATESIIHLVGFFILILLIIGISIKDVIKLF